MEAMLSQSTSIFLLPLTHLYRPHHVQFHCLKDWEKIIRLLLAIVVCAAFCVFVVVMPGVHCIASIFQSM